MSDIAVRVEHLSKKYQLGIINSGTLRQDIQTWIALKLGKEDPNSKIGEDRYAAGKDHFWALKDISFDIKHGDRVGIIGKNGAGKSTLLKILSRITAPTEGSVKIKGKIASLLEVGTGFHGELTGRENIYLNGAILGMKKRQVAKKMDSIIAFSGIEYHIDTPVKRYSSGMFVRLAFAVAAHLDSDILIADEVLAVGDAEFQKKALGKMEDLSTGEGRTIFFVSHNMGMIKRLCDTSILLNKGEIITSGKTSDVIDSYLAKKKEVVSKILRTDKKDVPAYINSIFTCDVNGNEKTEFAFSENIHLRMCLTFNEYNPKLNMGLAFLSKNETRIFTDNKDLKYVYDGSSREIVADYIIKGSFFLPSEYSFFVVINSHAGHAIYDELYDICPITIFDDGTDNVAKEGSSYGYFVVRDECEWRPVK